MQKDEIDKHHYNKRINVIIELKPKEVFTQNTHTYTRAHTHTTIKCNWFCSQTPAKSIYKLSFKVYVGQMCLSVWVRIALCVTKILNGTRQLFGLPFRGYKEIFPKYKQLYLNAVNRVIVTRAVNLRQFTFFPIFLRSSSWA